MTKVPTPAALSSLSKPTSVVSRGTPCDHLSEEDKTWVWLTDGPTQHAGTTWKWRVATLPLVFWDILEEQWWRKIFPVGRTLSSSPKFALHLKDNGQFQGGSPWFSLMVKYMDGTWLEIWWHRNLGKKFVDGPLWVGKKHRAISVPYECSPKRILSTKGFF